MLYIYSYILALILIFLLLKYFFIKILYQKVFDILLAENTVC